MSGYYDSGRQSRDSRDDVGRPKVSAELILQRLQDPNLRVQDHPQFESLIQQLMVNPEDPYLVELAMLTADHLAAEAALIDNPFRSNDPAKGVFPSVADMIAVLTMINGDRIGPAADRMCSGVISVGPTGIGKSTFIRNVLREIVRRDFLTLVFGRKKEHRHLTTHPDFAGKVTVFSLSDLCLAIGQPPPGIDVREWGILLCDLIAGCYGRLFAQRLLQELFEKLRLSGTVPDGTYISVTQLIHALRTFKPGLGRSEAQYRESMLGTMTAIRTTLGSVFGYVASNFLNHIFSKPGLFIIEVGDLPGEHYIFLVCLLSSWLNLGRGKGSLLPWPTTLFCLDDVTTAIDAQIDRNAPGGTSPLAKMTFMCRGQNIGFMLMAHGASAVSPKILANMENTIIHRLSGEDPRVMQHLLGITRDQIDRLRVLDRGEVVALFPSIHPLPVYGTFPSFDMPGCAGDAECQAGAARFLDKVTSVKDIGLPASSASDRTNGTDESQPSTDRNHAAKPVSLDPTELKLLSSAGCGVPVPVTVLYTQTGMNKRKSITILKRLEEKGLAKSHTFSTGKRGAPKKFIEVTDSGWRELERRGFARPSRLTEGSWEHDLAAVFLTVYARRHRPGVKVKYEVSLPGNRIDVVWKYNDGQQVFFNVGITSAKRELENAFNIVALPVLEDNRFVLVCRDSRFKKKVESLLKKHEKGGDLSKKIELKLMMDFV